MIIILKATPVLPLFIVPHDECSRSVPPHGEKIHEIEVNFPDRRFDTQSGVFIGRRDHKKMDDAGSELGFGIQSDHDITRALPGALL